ncbi:helix-turn-helix domain-containing protein [Azospirillum argentinense]|uniref:helix-turn-helix domain-containing protein n=1 Tax=Azospirillum argentinense TaxID=2970906 RepID=UPI0009E09A95|nr:helix-turn-helix domain-containing protein [Azospirillum argentinense]
MQTNQIALSVAEAKAKIGVGTTKFYELLNEGKIEAVKVGRKTLVLTDSLEKYVANLPRRPIKN